MGKNKQKIEMELDKKLFTELLLAAMLYSWVRGGLADSKGEDFKKYEELKSYLLKIAEDNGFSDLVEEFHGHLVPADKLSKLEEEIMEEYDDDAFWYELITRLGKRDFWRTVTPEEKEEIKKQDWLPERIHKIYEEYEREFEENGVKRLEVNKK